MRHLCISKLRIGVSALIHQPLGIAVSVPTYQAFRIRSTSPDSSAIRDPKHLTDIQNIAGQTVQAFDRIDCRAVSLREKP